MARGFYSYAVTVTPSANPHTICQIVAATNSRAVLHSVEVDPQGSTGATVPIPFDLVIQTTAGGLVDDSAAIVALVPTPTETRQTTILKRTGAEPAGTTTHYKWSVHQQGSRLWTPSNPFKEIQIAGGTRLGLRYLSGTFVDVIVNMIFEE